jgi:hypothetical protein
LRRLLLIPLLCCLALGQGVVLAPKAVWSPKTTIFPGASAGGATAALNGSPSTANCTGSATCSVTLSQSIPSGHFLIIGAATDLAATTMSSISVGGTLVPCTASDCVFNSGHALNNTNGGWVLSTTSTAGPVVITFSQVVHSFVAIYDYSCTGGTVSHDADNTADNATDTSPITGPVISTTGTNDVIVNWADGAGVDPTAVSAPFADFVSVSGVGFADHLNTNSGTGANFTAAGNSGGKTAAGIAMKCQ